MAKWLQRIAGRSEDGLPALLKTYPPYLGPFPGDSDGLLPGQAEANLAYLLARVDAVLGLLEARGVATGGALGQDDPRLFLERLWKWIEAEWPGIHSPKLTRSRLCRNPRGDGPEKALSLVTDVGILLGEMVLARKPDFSWALDLAPGNQGENGSLSQKQPVVFRAGSLPVGDIMFDPVGMAETVYIQCKSSAIFLLNRMAGGVMDFVGGAKERAAAERERAWQ